VDNQAWLVELGALPRLREAMVQFNGGTKPENPTALEIWMEEEANCLPHSDPFGRSPPRSPPPLGRGEAVAAVGDEESPAAAAVDPASTHHHGASPEVQIACCRAIWTIACHNPGTAVRISQEGLVGLMRYALFKWPEDRQLQLAVQSSLGPWFLQQVPAAASASPHPAPGGDPGGEDRHGGDRPTEKPQRAQRDGSDRHWGGDEYYVSKPTESQEEGSAGAKHSPGGGRVPRLPERSVASAPKPLPPRPGTREHDLSKGWLGDAIARQSLLYVGNPFSSNAPDRPRPVPAFMKDLGSETTTARGDGEDSPEEEDRPIALGKPKKPGLAKKSKLRMEYSDRVVMEQPLRGGAGQRRQ